MNKFASCPESSGNSQPRLSLSLAFSLGVYFALIQMTYFFLLEVFLSSRAFPFFIVLAFWLAGFLAGLNLPTRISFPKILAPGLLAYYAAWGILQKFPYHIEVLPVIGICIAVSAAAAGYYFVWAEKKITSAKNLFFYENNGFVAGLLVSLLWAVSSGKSMLLAGPLVGAIPACLILFQIRTFRTD